MSSTTGARTLSSEQRTSPPKPVQEIQSAGAILNTTPRPNPTIQRGLAPTMTVNNSAHAQMHVSNKRDATLTAASNTNARSLWAMAIEQLTLQERQTLACLGIESGTDEIASNLEVIRNEMEGMLKANREKPWQFTFRGETIVMRDVGRKILQWVDKFKEIGDIIIQYDPGHAALPWAGFRFLLKVKFGHQPLQLRFNQ